MSISDPELRAQVLEWQKKHQIRDDDPAMALIELLNIYGSGRSFATGKEAGAAIPSEELRAAITSSERVSHLVEELKDTVSGLIRQGGAGGSAAQLLPPEEMRAAFSNSEKAIHLIEEVKESISAVRRDGISAAGPLPAPEEMRAILSNSERTNFLLQEVKEIVAEIRLEEMAEQFKTYHEGIDFATQKMALIIKEGDDLLARLGKVAGQINPIARGAVVVLMIVSGVVGWLIAKLF